MATYPHEVIRTRLQIQKQGPKFTLPSTEAFHSFNGQQVQSHVLQSEAEEMRLAASTSGNGSAAKASTTTFSATTSHSNSTSPSPSTRPVTTKPKYSGIVKTIRKIWRNEGIKGFYRGLGVNLIRTVPASALTILTYVDAMLFFIN